MNSYVPRKSTKRTIANYHLTHTIPTVSGTKSYYISQRNYNGPFGVRDVLSILPNSTGKNRFYVMALNDYNNGATYTFIEACRIVVGKKWSTPDVYKMIAFVDQLGINSSNYSGYGLNGLNGWYWTSSAPQDDEYDALAFYSGVRLVSYDFYTVKLCVRLSCSF